MSLFRLRGPGQEARPDRPVTKTTVRLPRAIESATVVSVSGSYGDPVERHAPVMTLRVGPELKVVYAPRDGQLLPLTGLGDDLRGGDALFALHFEPEDDGAEPLGPRKATPLVLEEPRRRDLTPQLLRAGLSVALLVAGIVLAVPLLAEFGFGTTLETRLALALAGLALGALIWRLLGSGQGTIAAGVTGLAVMIWSGLVVLTLTGANPTGETVALPDSHALAPAARTRVTPAAPVAALSPTVGLLAVEGSAAQALERMLPLEDGIEFTARPAASFALGAFPAAPVPVEAARLAIVPEAAPPGGETPDVAGLVTVVRVALPSAPEGSSPPASGDLAGLPARPAVPATPRIQARAPEAPAEDSAFAAAVPSDPGAAAPPDAPATAGALSRPGAPAAPGQPSRRADPAMRTPAVTDVAPGVPDQSD